MQLQFPLFPKGAKMISDCVGVYEQDGLVQYIINGLPVYSHAKDDMNAFRFPYRSDYRILITPF